MEAIGNVLRDRHRVSQDDFTVMSQQDMLQTAIQVNDILTMFLGAVAGIFLVVGGIGIMNEMLVSLTERTREIGLWKAVGARRRDILVQFLIEAIVIAVLGEVVGIALGARIAEVIGRVRIGALQIKALVTPAAIGLTFRVSASIGRFFWHSTGSPSGRAQPYRGVAP